MDANVIFDTMSPTTFILDESVRNSLNFYNVLESNSSKPVSMSKSSNVPLDMNANFGTIEFLGERHSDRMCLH